METVRIMETIRVRVEMRITSYMRKGSIFRNIFSILTVLIAVMTVFNLIMTLYIRNRLFQDKMHEQDVYIDSYASSMNDAFENMQNIFTYLQRSDVISWRASFGYRESEDYVKNELAISDLLSTFSFTSTSINEILICWEDTSYLYTPRGLIERDLYFHNRFEGDENEWNSLMDNHYNKVTIKKVNEAVPIPQKGNDTDAKTSGIYLLQSIQTENMKYKGTICMVLEETLIHGIFRDRDFAKGRQIFVLGSDGRMIATNTDADLNEVLYGLDLTDIHNTSRYLRNRGLISHREAEMSGIEYVIFTPYKQMTGAFNRVFWTANLFSAATVVALLGYAYWSSRRMYKPFRGILNTLGGYPPQGDETKDETVYITNRVLDILSVNKTMHHTLQSSSHMVLQAVLYKLIMGSPSVEETLASVTPYQLSLSGGIYETAVVRMDLSSDQEELFYSEHHDTFDRILHAYLGTWVVEVLQTLSDEYTLVLCLKDKADQELLIRAIHEMYECWCRQIPGAAFCIGVSDSTKDIRKLRSCYEQSIAVLRRRPVQSDQAIFSSRSEQSSVMVPFLPDDLEAQLREFLEKADSDRLMAYVETILDRNYQDNVTYEAYLSACVAINRFVRRLVQKNEEGASSALIQIAPSSYVYTAMRCREIVLSNITLAAELLASRKGSVSVGDQISAYVDKHFREDINLATVANELGYTPNYISRYYKQANGINFTDYLNSRRIAFACEQLASTTKSLDEIAAMSGFHSSNFFIKVFKKYEGVTPGEYRKSMRFKTGNDDQKR